MKLSDVKHELQSLEQVQFKLPNGELVPEHFHVTEVGVSTKDFIDCGGVARTEKCLAFQLWTANDTDHRLVPEKLLKIIGYAENAFGDLGQYEVEVEYQSDTIGRYGLNFGGGAFHLTNKQTDCLAKDKCGITLPVVDCCGESGCC